MGDLCISTQNLQKLHKYQTIGTWGKERNTLGSWLRLTFITWLLVSLLVKLYKISDFCVLGRSTVWNNGS